MNDQSIGIERGAQIRGVDFERGFRRLTTESRRIADKRTSVANEMVTALAMATAGGLAMATVGGLATAAFLAGITAFGVIASAPVSVPVAALLGATVGSVMGSVMGLKAFTDTR